MGSAHQRRSGNGPAAVIAAAVGLVGLLTRGELFFLAPIHSAEAIWLLFRGRAYPAKVGEITIWNDSAGRGRGAYGCQRNVFANWEACAAAAGS